MASITLQNLDKWYARRVHAVRDVNLTIEDGEFFGLLGPSGSGKTSVLRMIAGLERPTGGSVRFDGVAVENKTPQQRNVAMVFEQNALYPHMTARENISYPLRIRGTARDEIARKVAEVAELLNIAHLLDRRAAQMSGGQQQRVAIARALVRRPNVLCLDEPIAHLDTLLRARLRGELKRLQRALGTTSVIVTHDPIEAMTMTDRLAVMRDGRLQQVGTPDEIHDRPCNVFVAQFFGLHSMNVLSLSDVTEEAGRLRARLGAVPVGLPRSVGSGVGPRGAVIAGARPGGLRVRKAGDGGETGEALELPARVYIAEQLGDAQLITVNADGVVLQALIADERRFAIDEPVTVSIPQDDLYLFDSESEATLRHAPRRAPRAPAAEAAATA